MPLLQYQKGRKSEEHAMIPPLTTPIVHSKIIHEPSKACTRSKTKNVTNAQTRRSSKDRPSIEVQHAQGTRRQRRRRHAKALAKGKNIRRRHHAINNACQMQHPFLSLKVIGQNDMSQIQLVVIPKLGTWASWIPSPPSSPVLSNHSCRPAS